MSEYELMDLFLSWGVIQESMVERFIALLFAFLVASYLVSHRLRSLLVVIVVALYSYMALRYVVFYMEVFEDQIRLAEYIVQVQAQEGSSIAWLEAPPGQMKAIYYSQAVAMFVSYLASLFFFFYQRRQQS